MIEEASEFYSCYPSMKPWLGKYYGKNSFFMKVLFVGESHYVPEDENSMEVFNPHKWYSGDENSIAIKDYADYITTKDIVKYNYDSNAIFRETGKVIRNKLEEKSGEGVELSENIFDYFAFYNYFLRPAHEGVTIQSILDKGLDAGIARKVYRHNVDVLEPDLIVFLSALAWDWAPYVRSEGDDSVELETVKLVPHPSSSWWNRNSEKYIYSDSTNLKGGELFGKIVENDILR